MIKKYLTFGLLATTLSACSSGEKSEIQPSNPAIASIVNGAPVEASNELTKQVLLLQVKSTNGESWTCTATALSKRILLTAAHCLTYDTESASVALIDSKTHIIKIGELKAAIRHEAYESPLDIMNYGDNDIALAILKSDLPADIKITSLYDGKSSYAKDDILIAGYGLTEKDPVIDGTREPNKDFRITLNSGKAIYEDSFDTITLLSPKSLAHGCLGDSGGPAFVKTSNGSLKQFGVLSRMSTADCLNKTIYESTTAQVDWLQYNLNKLNFYQSVSEGQKFNPTLQSAVGVPLKNTDVKKNIAKILNLVKNEYIEYKCFSLKKDHPKKEELDLFESLTQEITTATAVTIRKSGTEIEFTLTQENREQNNALTHLTLATSSMQTFIPKIIRTSKTVLGTTKSICEASFINAIEMK